jgi:cytochrome c oxidase subunit II
LLVLALAAGCGGAGKQPPSESSAASSAASSAIAAMVPATSAELAEGRRLFQASAEPAGCSFCHSLRAAANTSPLGPSLDAEMNEPQLRNLSDAAVAQRVRDSIREGDCLNPVDAARCMPADSFTGKKADTLAVFVATCGRKPTTPGCEPVDGGLRGAALAGRRLYQTRGCVGCHFTLVGRPAGPPLYGIAGSTVTLADGTTVTADDAYLVESLTTPDRRIVQGYQAGLMSARVSPQHLTRAQVLALVAYTKTLK